MKSIHPPKQRGRDDASVLLEYQPPIGPGVRFAEALHVSGFKNLYLAAGSLCLIERAKIGGPVIRVLVLDRTISPFYPPRDFWVMSRTFSKRNKEGGEFRWIAFYRGFRRPRYVFRSIPRGIKIWRFKFFNHPKTRGPKRTVNYREINSYKQHHPNLSHAQLAKRFRCARSTIARVLKWAEFSNQEERTE